MPRGSCLSAAAAAAADDDTDDDDDDDDAGMGPTTTSGGRNGDSGGSGSVRPTVRWCRAEADRSASGVGVVHDDADDDAAIAQPSSAVHSWHRLETRWEADEEAAMEGDLLDLLSPTWRILLLSDGSVTRHLRLLCPQLRQTRLECLRQGPVVPSSSSSTAGESRETPEGASRGGRGHGLPRDCELISGPMVQREVLLRISRGSGEENDGDGREKAGFGPGGGGGADGTFACGTTSGVSGDGGGDDDMPMVYAASW